MKIKKIISVFTRPQAIYIPSLANAVVFEHSMANDALSGKYKTKRYVPYSVQLRPNWPFRAIHTIG